MNAAPSLLRAARRASRAHPTARSSVSRAGLSSNGIKESKSLASSSRLIAGLGNGTNNIHKRFIALYRPTHMPWTPYELSPQPELAKECEERVVAAYNNNQGEEARMHFHRYRSIGVMPNTNTWRKFLLMAYKDGNYHEIQSLFHTLITFGVSPDVTAWNFLLDVVSKKGLVRQTEQCFWNAIQETRGAINEFTIRAFFNVLMQEKRYLRAMIAYAGMQEYGFSITAEERSTLEKFCQQHIADRPGGFEPLSVPEEDAAAVAEAFALDRITFGHANVLSCSDNLSHAGRNAVLNWYAKRATNISTTEAFNMVLDTARTAWESNISGILGVEPLHLTVVRGWINSGPNASTISFDKETAEQLEERVASGPFNLGSFSFEDGSNRFLAITKTPKKGDFLKHIFTLEGKSVSADEAKSYNEYITSLKPMEFIRSSL